MNQNEKIESLRKTHDLQPGDLILIRTPSTVYETFRRMANHTYDHIVRILVINQYQSVVLDGEMSLHISYPRTKQVPTLLFAHKKKKPLIIRPKLTDQQRLNFLETLRKDATGKPYDYMRVVQIIVSSQLYEMKKYDVNKSDKIVCSHQIFQSLAQWMPNLTSFLDMDKDFDIHKFGTFTISDFVRMAKNRRDSFDMFELYTKEEIENDQGNDIDFEGIVVQIGNNKELSIIDKVFQLGALKKLEDMIEKYKFLKTFKDQSKPIIEQIFALKKQIVFVITIYKMLDIIYTAYKEYKELSNLEQRAKNQTKLKAVKEIITQLAQLLILTMDTKQTMSHQLMKPLTKLMIMTNPGNPGDIKIQVIKMMTVIMGFTQKFRERFKL